MSIASAKAPANAILFLGGGRITAALAAGLRRSGYRGAIVVHDRHAEKLQRLRRECGVITEGNLRRAVASARLLLIAVRPASVRELLASMGKLRRPAIVISLAAGIPLAALRAQIGPPAEWARAMPSPACRTGHGLTALAFSRAMPERSRDQVRQLFGRVGKTLEIAEGDFDAFTVTYSPSHGYHALGALSNAAVNLGLDRDTALTAAAHALGDAILSWREGESSLKELLEEAATPGGIAATVMVMMEGAGYSKNVELSVRAGLARARAAARPQKGTA